MSWKHYNPGEILTADDANMMMDQGRIVVANAAELAIIAGQPGMVVYRLDNRIEYDYIGSAWIPRDTGWVDISLSTGWTGEGAAWRRIGRVAYLRGFVTKAGMTNNEVVGNLPADARGFFGVYVCAPTGTEQSVPTRGPLLLRINSSGEMRVLFDTPAPAIINLAGIVIPDNV